MHETHSQTNSPAVAHGAQLALAASVAPLNDPSAWVRSPAYKAPLAADETAAVQKEIDSIVGTTRENKSICLLVWNGDERYWKQFHDKWDASGAPVGDPIKRPIVLYRSVFDGEIFQHDAFPPRWLLLIRLEPEQYFDTWRYESKFYHPQIGKEVQILPSEPPKERWLWWRTIAEHRGGCCTRANREDHNCWGFYAHPRYCLDDLRRIQASIERDKPLDTPFAAPSAMVRKFDHERGNHNYVEQTLAKAKTVRERLLDEAPMSIATPREFMKSPDLVELRRQLIERSKHDMEKLEKDLEKRRLK
jgi:hypothetical protein